MEVELRSFREHMKLERVPVDDILLDPNNYRFRGEEEAPRQYSWEEISDETTQASTTTKLLKGSKELQRSILTTLGPIERPIVVPYGDGKRYVVLEGNRRVACCKILKEEAREDRLPPEVPKDTFDFIEVLVLPKELDTPEIRRVILGPATSLGFSCGDRLNGRQSSRSTERSRSSTPPRSAA